MYTWQLTVGIWHIPNAFRDTQREREIEKEKKIQIQIIITMLIILKCDEMKKCGQSCSSLPHITLTPNNLIKNDARRRK